MLPEEQGPPPGLADVFGGMPYGAGPDAPPDSIQVTPPGAEEGDEEESSAADHLRQAIEHAQAALQAEPDDADSAKLAKIVQGLYDVLAGQQDADMSVMGGNPKQMRAMNRAYAG